MERKSKPNNHHVLYTRAVWESQDATRQLRRKDVLIPELDPEHHGLLHKTVAVVPVLDHNTAPRVLRDFQPVGTDTIRSIQRLMWIIDKERHHFRASEIERRLGELTILALELQLPFIREGILPDAA